MDVTRRDISQMVFEMKQILKLGWPMTVSVTLYALMFPITLAFCGYLGKDQLDMAALGISLYQLVVNSVENGIRWSCIGLFSQALGGTNKKRVGIILQRGVLSAFLIWCGSFSLALNTRPFLILIGQDEELSKGAENFVLILMPGCLSVLLYRLLMSYMDSLGHVFPTLLINTFAVGVCVFLNYLFVLNLEYGYKGAALGLCISQVLLPTMTIIYIICSKLYVSTWPGWSAKCFLEWKEFYTHLIPSVLVQLSRILGNEIWNFLCGIRGKTQLAVQGIIFQLFILSMQPTVGFGTATIARLSKYFAARDINSAKRVYVVSNMFQSLMAITMFALTYGLRYEIPKLFSADEETKIMFQDTILYVALFTSICCIWWGSVATLRAANYHLFILIAVTVAAYLVAYPVGVPLLFLTNLETAGVWIANLVSQVASTIMLITKLCLFDWANTSAKVSKEANKETDVETFMVTDEVETQPLLNKTKTKQKSGNKTEGKHSSGWLMFKTKLPLLIVFYTCVALLIILRIFLPRPEISKNSTTIFSFNGTDTTTTLIL